MTDLPEVLGGEQWSHLELLKPGNLRDEKQGDLEHQWELEYPGDAQDMGLVCFDLLILTV